MNQQSIIWQSKAVGGPVGGFDKGITPYVEETQPPKPTAKPIMQPPKPHRPSVGLMPTPSKYAKMERPPPDHSKTKYGRPKKGINIFRDCRFTASYLSQHQRNAMASNRRYQRRR